MAERERGRWYEHIDAALLRASVHAGDAVPVPWPDLGDADKVEQWCTWLAKAWAQPDVADAVRVASPVLADRVEAVCAGLRPGAGQVRRMVLAVARYRVRMRGRATPFGMFAGVTAVRFGTAGSVQWTGCHQVRLRADAVWLAGVITRLESCAELRQRLPVTANDLAVLRGERLVLPWQPHARDPGRASPADVSVRYTPAVRAVMDAASSPIRVSEVIGMLANLFPGVPARALAAMVAELIACGVLITSLRPPSTVTDGLGHILDRLQEADAAAVPQAAPLIAQLNAVHGQLLAASGDVDQGAGPIRNAVASRMRMISRAAEQPLMVDLQLGCAAVLPRQVAAEAGAAATALLRLTPAAAGHPAWREYHGRFIDRYGPGAIVRVSQLTDAGAGLGFPRHYQGPERPIVVTETSRRDSCLLALAQQAALDGAQEVMLDDDSLDHITSDNEDGKRPVPHIDLCAEVRAATILALDQGMFTLAVCGIGRSAATTGRFLDLLPSDDRRRVTSAYAHLPARTAGALTAQLSFPPQHLRTENAGRAVPVIPDIISLAEHHDSACRRIELHDLAVTADQHRLYLLSLSRRCVVETVLPHAAARHTIPALARLLLEIPRAGGAAVSPFGWGTAACLPFLPRVRYGRSILCPARWQLTAGTLPGPGASRNEWTAAMQAVRGRLRLPASVSVGTADRRLRLNLDDPMDLDLLRAHLNTAAEPATLTEAPDPVDLGWIAGRAHEIVIPLAATTPPAPAPIIVTSSAPWPVINHVHGELPGSQVLYAQLSAHPDVFNIILVRHLPVLLAMWDVPPLCWFTRSRDQGPHLRVRLHGLGDYGQAAACIGTWAAALRQQGIIGDLTLATYHPETGRYGTGLIMAVAENLFAADSAAVLAQLGSLAAAPQVHPPALTAASMADLAGAMLGSPRAGAQWLISHPELAGRAPVRDREILRQAVQLAETGMPASAPASLCGTAVAAAWEARRLAAARYARCLTPDATHITPAAVVPSLLHMHYVRAHGIDPDAEATAFRLARAIGLSCQARHDQTGRTP